MAQGGHSITAADIWITPRPLTLRGETGALEVRLADEAWSRLAVDPRPVKVATIHVNAPWASRGATTSIELFVTKERYAVKVAPISISLSSKVTPDEDKPRSVTAWLDTDLNVSEPVALRAFPGYDRPESHVLRFKSVDTPGSFISLQVAALSFEKRIGNKPGATSDQHTLTIRRVL